MAREILCPSCSQPLRVRDGFTGTSLSCPKCNASVPVMDEEPATVEAVQTEVPAALPTAVQDTRPAPRPDMQRCPYCRAEIGRGLRRCPQCREWLDEEYEQPLGSIYKPCPKCGTQESQRVIWTFWGSFYGPSLFTHVRCARCGYAYNGKTGRSNVIPAIFFVTVPILGIVTIIGGLILWVFYLSVRY